MLHCTQSKGQTFVQDSLATGSFPPAFLSALGAFVVHQFFEGVIAEKVNCYNCCSISLAATSWHVIYVMPALFWITSTKYSCNFACFKPF
jgi:hypothetical protein